LSEEGREKGSEDRRRGGGEKYRSPRTRGALSTGGNHDSHWRTGRESMKRTRHGKRRGTPEQSKRERSVVCLWLGKIGSEEEREAAWDGRSGGGSRNKISGDGFW